MATQLQLRRGTKVQNDVFTGAEAELTYDTTRKSLRIHDGTTLGGIPLIRQIMPDLTRSENMSLATNPVSSSAETYTCPADGWLFIVANRNSSGNTMTISVNDYEAARFSAFSAFGSSIWIPVSEGDVVKATADSANATWTIVVKKFIYCKGS